MKKPDLLSTPSRKKLLTVVICWASGTCLLLTITSNFFTENPFQRRYALMYLIMTLSTTNLGRLWYGALQKKLKQNKTKNHE